MVGDHSGHSQLLRKLELAHRRDAVVTGQNGVHPVRRGRPDNGLVDPVAVLHPVRDLIVHGRPKALQPPVQDVGGADPVDVVVPHDADSGPCGDLPIQDFHRPFHIRQQARIIHLLHVPEEITPDGLLPHHVPVADNPRRHRADVEFRPDLIKIRLLGVQHPFRFYHLFSHFFYVIQI